MSHADLCKKLGWSRSRYYQHIKRGFRVLPTEIENLSKVIGIKVDTLIRKEYEFYTGWLSKTFK